MSQLAVRVIIPRIGMNQGKTADLKRFRTS